MEPARLVTMLINCNGVVVVPEAGQCGYLEVRWVGGAGRGGRVEDSPGELSSTRYLVLKDLRSTAIRRQLAT